MKINWEPGAWDEYVDWQTTDKAMLKRINRMIKEIQRTPFIVVRGGPAQLDRISGFLSERSAG